MQWKVEGTIKVVKSFTAQFSDVHNNLDEHIQYKTTCLNHIQYADDILLQCKT